MKYVITGKDGLIGGFLNRRLKEEGHKSVLEIDSRSGFNIMNLGSVRLNPNTQHTDIVLHLAAHCKINEGIQYPELPHTNNADGIHHVLEFCRRNKIPKIINFSSSRVLSSEENTYTASKKYTENLTKAYGDCYGLEWITVRPSTVYGPCHDVTSRLMTDWCQQALKNKEMPLYGDEHKTLDFTHVDDFVDGILLLINNWDAAKNKAYNISGENEVNLLTLASYIIQEANGGYVKMHPAEIAQPQRVKIDISEMKKLGYKPKIGIQDGVKQMVDFYRRRNDTE